MTFHEDTSHLARELATLAHSGSSRALDRDGLAVALVARRDTLRLVRQVLVDVTNRHWVVRDAPEIAKMRDEHSIREAEQRPVAMLMRMLAASPKPTLEPTPEFGAMQADTSEAARGWAEVRRRALLAGHEWSERPPLPVADQQWTAVADTAAIARAVAILDHDLTHAARALPTLDPHVVQELTTATTSGLRLAATEATDLARAGELPEWAARPRERHPLRVLQVLGPEHVPAAQSRLASQIRDGGHLSPQTVVQLADGQARFLDTAARALAAVDPDRAHQARHLGQAIRTNITGSRRLAALMPDDPRPMAQTRALLLGLAPAASRGWHHPWSQPYIATIAQGVDGSRGVLRALSAHASNAVYTGRWLVPNLQAEAPGDHLWRRARPKEWGHQASSPFDAENEPPLLKGLSAVTARADTLPRSPAQQDKAARPPAPRNVLADVVSPARTRPPTVAQSLRAASRE